jgi:hypothetical protein
LVKNWGDTLDLRQKLEATEVALFFDSYGGATRPEFAEDSNRTTQADIFTATGYQIADDLVVTLLSARTFKKRLDQNPLSLGEWSLYQRLRNGLLRSRSAAIYVNDNGALSVKVFDSPVTERYRPLGSPSSRG